MKKITGMQLRMARVALKWRVDDLSKASDVGWARIQNMEKDNGIIENSQVEKLVSTLESKGISFEKGDENYQPYVRVKI